jgi:hypothetical protein
MAYRVYNGFRVCGIAKYCVARCDLRMGLYGTVWKVCLSPDPESGIAIGILILHIHNYIAEIEIVG